MSLSSEYGDVRPWISEIECGLYVIVDANKVLRENILDIPVWEEAVLFACDRLSRADEDGINAVARAILETLGIDPLLSAEMIWRSSDDVWDQVRDDVVSFAREWHTPGRVDRAAQFMIDMGRAEFSEFVWPLVSDADDQIHLRVLRAGRTVYYTHLLTADCRGRDVGGYTDPMRCRDEGGSRC
jgi:hypothetical protein